MNPQIGSLAMAAGRYAKTVCSSASVVAHEGSVGSDSIQPGQLIRFLVLP
jgi:hypothetical protein